MSVTVSKIEWIETTFDNVVLGSKFYHKGFLYQKLNSFTKKGVPRYNPEENPFAIGEGLAPEIHPSPDTPVSAHWVKNNH